MTFPEVLLYLLFLWLSIEGFVTNRYGFLTGFAFRELIVFLLYLALLPSIAVYWCQSFGRRLSTTLVLFGLVYVVQVFNPTLPNIMVGLVGIRDNLWYVPLFVVGFVVLGSELRLSRLLFVAAGLSALSGIAAVVQLVGGESRLLAFGPGYSRAIIYTGIGESFLRTSGLAASPGLGGTAFAVGCVCAVLGVVIARRWKQRALLIAAGGVCFCALLLSGCRGWFAFLAIWFVLLWMLGRERRTWVTVAALFACAIFVLAVYELHEGIGDRYATLLSSETLWSRLNGLFVYRLTHMLPQGALGFGSGVASTGSRHFVGGQGLVPIVESDYVRIAYDVGIPGLICFALALVLLAGRTLRLVERTRTVRIRLCVAGVLSLQIATMMLMFVGVPMLCQPFPQFFWLMSGAACAVVSGRLSPAGQPERALIGNRVAWRRPDRL